MTTHLTPPVRDLTDSDRDLASDYLSDGLLISDRPAGVPAAAEEIGAREMTLPGHRIRVVLELDGELVSDEIRADNRDFLRWDKTAPRQKWDARTQPFLLQTFLAWAAMRRTGRTDLTFDQFGESCLEAKDVKEEDGDEARPTR